MKKAVFVLIPMLYTYFVYSQKDSVKVENTYRILVGGLYQRYGNNQGDTTNRYGFEVGIHKSTWKPIPEYKLPRKNFRTEKYFFESLTTEVIFDKKPIVGLKYGIWAYYFLAMGISGGVYTDFTHYNFVIKPEFGFGFEAFKITGGFIVPFGNQKFERMKNPALHLSLNIFLLPEKRKEKWVYYQKK